MGRAKRIHRSLPSFRAMTEPMWPVPPVIAIFFWLSIICFEGEGEGVGKVGGPYEILQEMLEKE